MSKAPDPSGAFRFKRSVGQAQPRQLTAAIGEGGLALRRVVIRVNLSLLLAQALNTAEVGSPPVFTWIV